MCDLAHRGDDNCLALYELSARMQKLVNKKPLFWIGVLRSSGLISSEPFRRAAAADARRRKSQDREATASATRTLYSPHARCRAKRRWRARAPSRWRARWPTTLLPRYKVDASGDLVPDLRAAAAIIYDPETNQVLWEENSQTQRSIASITKVMTATVFLENNPDLIAAGHHRAQRRLPGVDDASARERSGHGRRSAAPAAHRVRQRRGARARARLAATVRTASSSG